MHTRQAVFNFTNATQLVIEWPGADPEGAAVSVGELHRALGAPQFHAQVGGNLMVIQMANVNYVEIIPAPESLPAEVVRHATARRVE